MDFLLQIVFYSSTRTWLIAFSVDEYHRIFKKKNILVIFTNLRVGDIIHSLSSGEISTSLISPAVSKSEITQAMI